MTLKNQMKTLINSVDAAEALLSKDWKSRIHANKLPMAYLTEFDSNEIYLHYGCSDILRACKVERKKKADGEEEGYWWTVEGVSLKATSVPMMRWSDLRDTPVIYFGVPGKLKIVQPDREFENSQFCHCYWEQHKNAKGLVLPCGWIKLKDLFFPEYFFKKEYAHQSQGISLPS